MVAGTALGVLTPMAAQASEAFNLEAMNSYERSGSKAKRFDSTTFTTEVSNEIATLKGRIDGLEVRQGDIEAGSFSNTTTLDGKAIFSVGALNYHDSSVTSSEAVQAYYSYTMNLNSSITGGDDNLYVRIKTGNTNDWMKSTTYGAYLSSAKGNSDDLKIDKIWYQFPIGDNNTVWVGPKIENYYMHGTSPSIYKPVTKQFTLGGNGNAYGASTDTGAGWAYKADNGFAISSNVGTKSKSTKKVGASYVDSGLLTDETKTSFATQIGYTQPQYAVSAIVNLKYNGWADGYLHTMDADSSVGTGNHTAYGLRGWWRPEETGSATPSVTVGYDTTEYEGSVKSSDMWFVGLQWQDLFNPDDKVGLALAQPTKLDNQTEDPFAWELYYSYKANDSVTVTPTIFGGTDREGDSEDVFGAVVQTVFKF